MRVFRRNDPVRIWLSAVIGLFLLAWASPAQDIFTVTGTPIPASLIRQNYGKMPRGITAYDLSICNSTEIKHSIVSSEIYQALSKSNTGLQPIGRQIMLTAILRNQSWTLTNILGVTMNVSAGILSVLNSSKIGLPSGVATGATLASLSLQQVLSNLKPVSSADQLEKFESQVLEPALVLDGGSCVERTVFTVVDQPAAKGAKLSFHVR